MDPKVEKLLAPLLKVLPFEEAMKQLVVERGALAEQRDVVTQLLEEKAFRGKPAVAAGLWLYVDELDRSHAISQNIHDATGSFWHGIMHRREGDFSNSHYWFHRVGAHPAIMDILAYDSHQFIDEVEKLHRQNPERLIKMQRAEWLALFTWCLQAS